MNQRFNNSVSQWGNESMNQWTSEWTNEWMNERMNEWTNERTNEWTNEQMNKWRNEGMKEWRNEGMKKWGNEGMKEGRKEGVKEGRKEGMNEWTNKRMNEWTNERMNEWTNERMNEWTNERMNEWTNERMNEWTNERMNEWRNEGMKECRNEGMKEWRNEGRNEWINESMNESMNQWINEICQLYLPKLPWALGFLRFYVKSSSGYSPVHFLSTSSSRILCFFSEIELSLQSFVDNFCRLRPETAETETPWRPWKPLYPRNHTVSRPRVFSSLNSRLSELLHFPTWWHDDMVDMTIPLIIHIYIYIYVAEGITDNVDYTGVSENGTDQDYKIFGNIWAIPFWPRLRHPLPTTGGMSNIPPSSISICPFFQVLPVLQHQVTRSRHAENVQRRERYAMGGAKTVVCRQHLKNGVYCLESAVKNVVTIYIRQFWYVLVCSCKW